MRGEGIKLAFELMRRGVVVDDAPLDERNEAELCARACAWADAGGGPLEQLDMSFASLPLPEWLDR